MRPRYRHVLKAIPETGSIHTGKVAAKAKYSHLDTRFILNALQHQGLVGKTGDKVFLTDAGRRIRGREQCTRSA